MLEKRLRMAKSGMEETAQGRVFLTVHVPSPQLVITGAVHISQTLAPIGQLLGYDVTIVDPRTAFASIERFPDVKVIARMAGRGAAAAQCRPLHGLRRAHARSEDRRSGAASTRWRATASISARSARKKTHAKRVARLKEAGLSDADIARIHAPIGLDIGAVSPAEIAVAIMAEITARLRHEGGEGGGGMKFGPVAPADALGATAVHSIRQGDLVLKKGTLIGPAEVAALKAAGVKEIVVARLEPGDVSEDQAAADIAAAVPGEGVRADRAFTGRCNLFAETAGVLVRRQGRDRPAQPHRRGGDARDAAGLQAGGRRRDDRDREDHSLRGRRRRARPGGGAKPPRRSRSSASRPTRCARSASFRRCCRACRRKSSRRRSRSPPRASRRPARPSSPSSACRTKQALARAIDEVLKAGAELVIVFGASAIADRRDVIPAAIEAVGGEIEHFGMPVDPGNLMLIGAAAAASR